MGDIPRRMPLAIASAAEAIFTVMGVPMLLLRQSAVAMAKWRQLIVAHQLILLGFLFNTRTMTMGVPDAYRKEILALLDTVWHDGRQSFTISEIEQLVGKLGRIAQAFRPLYHLMPHLYASVAYTLRVNKVFVALLQKLKARGQPQNEEDVREINFAVGQVARKVHGVPVRYRIPPTLKKRNCPHQAHPA